MGVDFGDADGDGLLDIVVTNFEMETNALYRNLGSGLFVDGRFALNVAESSLLNLAFGVAFCDLDHDGDLDLAVANGHIHDNAAEINENSAYAQRNQILANDGKGRFEELADVGMDPVLVSRGLVPADLDGDGDLDLAIINSNGPAEIYENLRGAETGNWILLDLVSASANRFAIGARVEVPTEDGVQVRERRTASSFMSQAALTLHFGLAEATVVPPLTVRWPDGRRSRYSDLPVNRRFLLSD